MRRFFMRSKKRNKRIKKEGVAGLASLLCAALLSLLITIPLSMLLLLLAAALLLRLDDPGAAASVVSIAILFICAMLCGLIAVRLHRRRLPLLSGTVAGLLLLFCLCIVSAFMPATTASHSLLITLLLHAALLPLSILGAKLGGREKKKKRFH